MEKQVFYNFENSIFSKNSLFRWVYCLENSALISFHIIGFESVFYLLTYFAGFDALLIHNSLKSIYNNDDEHVSKREIEESNFFSFKFE